MVGAPNFKASAGVEYAFDWKPAGGDLWARFDYSYQSATYQSLYYASAAYQNAQNARIIPVIPSIRYRPIGARLSRGALASSRLAHLSRTSSMSR